MTLASPVAYLSGPADICNQALDALGHPELAIGDVTDGTDIAEVTRRSYGQALRGLLRTAHWGFARKQDSLTLLADTTGQTAGVSTQVEPPWTYAYAWPIDGVAGRWMPMYVPDNTTQPPQTTGLFILPPVPLLPQRFLVSSSNLYPVEVGTIPWDQQPDLQRTEGVGPINRRIILTDQANALFVYTRLVTVIEEWDSLFLNAMVALIALSLLPTAIKDPKERTVLRSIMDKAARMAIADARVANGNDAGWPQTVSTQPIWISARSGGLPGYSGGLTGYPFLPYDSSFSWCGGVY